MASEPTLERDFNQLLEFDSGVQSYDVQPVEISYLLGNDLRTYTPDVRVDYICSKKFKTTLFEVKYRSDLAENWTEYKPKFKAAIRYAKAKGMRFKLVTEREIRTPLLNNIKFLLPYRGNQPVDAHESILLKRLRELRECDPETLLIAIFRDKWSQAELIPSLWRLIATGSISANLNVPLSMSTRIWSRQ